MDGFVKALPGFILGLIVTVIVNLVVFSGNMARLEAKVEYNSDTIKSSVKKSELDILETQVDRNNQRVLVRIDQLDRKIDTIYTILINKR